MTDGQTDRRTDIGGCRVAFATEKKNETICFDTDEVAGLDSTDIVDEYTTDCVVIADQKMTQELVYVYVFLTTVVTF